MKTGTIIHQFTAKDGRKIVLRTPKWEDLDDFLEFINSLVEEGADISKREKVTKEQETEWLGRGLAELENDKVFMLVAEVDGKVVANSELGRKSGFSEHVGGIGIGIRDGYRDVGVGTEMLRILIAQAKRWNLKILELGVFATNDRARHVYRKIGFKETGRIPKEVFKDGKYVDHIIMTMEL
jgi:RimJ/RimL family protein N-acetyltransferase